MSEAPAGKFALLLIFTTVFIDLIGFGIIIPLLPTYAEKYGAHGLVVGLLLMSYSLAQFICAPFWGRLSDRIGRRPVLLISLAASAVGYCIWGMANSLVLLFLARIVAGAGNANLAVAQAYITDVTTPENRSKGMGLVGAAFGLGFVLGPAIGGGLSFLGEGHVGFIAAGFSVLDLALTAFFLPEPPKRSMAAHDRFRTDSGFVWRMVTDKKLSVPMLVFFVSTFAFANMEATLVLMTERWYGFGRAENSWMFTYIGFLIVMVQGGLIGRLSKRYPEKSLVAAGALLTAIGLALTGIHGPIWLLAIALAFLAFGSGISTPPTQSIVSKLAPVESVGGAMGVNQSMGTLGRILGPVAGGYAFDHFGLASPYFFGCACMLVAVALSFKIAQPPANGGSGGGGGAAAAQAGFDQVRDGQPDLATS